MVDLYVTLIIAKRKTFNSIKSSSMRDQVREALKNKGYDTKGEPLVQ